MSNNEIQKWSDRAMFAAEPVDDAEGPKVYLLEMTSDPLGSVAALSAMYTGKVVRSKADVTDEERDHHLREMQLTKLTTPLESVKFHFMLEGVTRAFTHQLVRNRTSAYAQESMRFAVKEDLPVALPPSLAGTIPADSAQGQLIIHEFQDQRIIWDQTVDTIRKAYNDLVNMGMPAEDARGLAPTNVLTRINWVTDLRTLKDVLGVRLCTQAQFEWRAVGLAIADAIRNAYDKDRRYIQAQYEWDTHALHGDEELYKARLDRIRYEYDAIASLFKPICYFTGKCEFMSQADRYCAIRDRVQANHTIDRHPSEWGKDHWDEHGIVDIRAIHDEEWRDNAEAARIR
jgi:flavin-dependent thymidylate synthase